ncbi:MAG: hypothetical protein WD274_12520 [Acidimicrobiia bacterium]
MSGEVRPPEGIEAEDLILERGLIFWAKSGAATWDDAKAELTAAFERSREAARSGHSFVYIVTNDALLGRNGPADAMVAAGLVSAARTAAIEGWKKGWTANVVAYDDDHDPAGTIERAAALVADGMVTGELVHIGPGHIGKALA